jgi:hypothetical protein
MRRSQSLGCHICSLNHLFCINDKMVADHNSQA